MIYAQIKDNKVKNCIVLNEEDILSLFLEGYDDLIRVDDLNPRPGIGDDYIDGIFSRPPEDPVDDGSNS